jgi:hypothetical protein
MAEGNANRPAPETLTTEDVDRLSERFKPSWEVEPQAEPTGQALKQTMVGGTAPAAPLAPVRAPAAPTGAAPAPAPPTGSPLVAKPMTTVAAAKSGLEVARAVRHPTLVGIAPQPVRQVSGAPQAAPDDLDWEVPGVKQGNPAPDLAQTARLAKAPEVASPKMAEASRIQPVQAEPPRPPVSAIATPAVPARSGPDEDLPIDVEELPPESKPSGIGQKYVPRDQDAPAIVLDEEVQRTEAQARATMEAQHRARSAPTIAKMPAVRVPVNVSAADFADEDTVTHLRKRGRGVWVVLALLTLGGGVAVAATLLRKPELPPPAAQSPVERPTAAADSAAPPPPAVAVEPEPAPVVRPVAEPAEPAGSGSDRAKEPAKRAVAAPPVQPPAETPKRAATPAPRPAAKPRPAPTTKSGSGSARQPKPAVIVRDNPF